MIDTPKAPYLNGDGTYLRAGPATVGISHSLSTHPTRSEYKFF
jgi:hypothetical protein